MTGTLKKTSWGGTIWRPDYHTQKVIDSSTAVQAMIDAMAVQCPECSRVAGNACELPAGLEHLGIFVHHQRIAAGARA
jgi:hypothetical protein